MTGLSVGMCQPRKIRAERGKYENRPDFGNFFFANFYHTKVDNQLKCTYNFELTMLHQYQILDKIVDTRLHPPHQRVLLPKELVYKCL